MYQVGSELDKALGKTDDNVLPYVCIEGVTRAVGKPLRSHYVDDEMGVIQHILLVEHKSKRTQGYWYVFLHISSISFIFRILQISSEVFYS